MQAGVRQWRSSLREDAADRARWQRLARAAEALAHARDPAAAAASVLEQACASVGARDGCVVGADERVLAGRGLSKPAGAQVTGARAWASLQAGSGDGFLFERGNGAGWRLSGLHTHSAELHLPVRLCGRTLGVLLLAFDGSRPDADELRALMALAGLLGGLLLAPGGARRLRHSREDGRLALLTARERQVLALLPRGYSNADLAQALGIAPGTVKTHVERILRKLDCRDRTQAAVLATRAGAAT